MTEDRIIPDAGDLYWTEVNTLVDWSMFNDEAGIVAATGFPAGTRSHHIYCSFWEGSGDPDDVCSVRLNATGAFGFYDFDDTESEFGTPPDAGADIYLVGCFVKAA